MAHLSVSETLLNPMIADRFTVVSRTQTVGDNGRAKMVQTAFPGVVGIVTVASPDDLERLDDNDRGGRNIVIVTKYPLRGPARQPGEADSKPDWIEWLGDTYQVKALDPYPQYGAGFCQAIAGSINAIEEPMS